MARGPDKPGEIYTAYVQDVRRILGEELEGVVVLGDAVTGDYEPTRSRIEFLLAVKDDRFARVKSLAPVVADWHKRRVATPLIASPGYVRSSLDASTHELFNMQLFHEAIWGQDVLAELAFDPGQLRIGCEHQAKACLQGIKGSYLETEGELKRIAKAMAGSIDEVVQILRTLIHLRGKEPPGPRRRVFKSAGKIFNLSEAVFLRVLACRDEGTKETKAERAHLFEEYVGQLEAVAGIADEMGEVE
ncbi:MAG: hypothetical protein PVF43_01765 [Candidatus Eiseniibacteriota bacterium]|jgi:hypothetical protein